MKRWFVARFAILSIGRLAHYPAYSLIVMPDLIRHPEAQAINKELDSPSTVLRVMSLSNRGSSPV